MTNPFAGLEVHVPPPSDDLTAVAHEAALSAFWATEWATRTAIAACWSAFDAGLDTRAARQAAGAAGAALEAAITALAAFDSFDATLEAVQFGLARVDGGGQRADLLAHRG
ncbi:MAG: hypothetical protein ABTR07_14440 [Candidatus Competibacter denitrificans]